MPDPLSREATAAMGARAFAYGGDVFLGPGESQRDTGLMAHELAHVVQQGAAGTGVQRLPVAPADSPAERHADAVADRVTGGAPTAALIIEPGATAQPGQMPRDAFLRDLRAAITAAVDQELGPIWNVLGCPYIEQWFSRHASDDATSLDRLARRYSGLTAPRSAAEFIPPICERVRAGARRWQAGESLSAELSAAGLAGGGAGAGIEAGPAAATKPRPGAPPPAGPTDVAEPEAGERLDPTTASRMGSALGEDLSSVRIHTGEAAARATADTGAAAVTAGSDVAFAPGRYQPGTPAGDALLAHELAHTVQQRGAAQASPAGGGPAAESAAHESDADQATVGVMARLWGGASQAARKLADRARPALTSSYQLQRCPDPPATVHDAGPPADAGGDADAAAPVTRPPDQHAGTARPDTATTGAIQRALNPTAVDTAPPTPVGGPAPALPPPAEWDASLVGLDATRDAAEIRRRTALRTVLKNRVTRALGLHLRRVRPAMRREERADRLPATRFEGAANAAKGKVDGMFSGIMAAASATPSVAAGRHSLVYRGAESSPGAGDQNLFDANDEGDRAAAGRAIDPYDVADWMANTDERSTAAFESQHFNPSRAGSSEESDFLADQIIAPFVTANERELRRYDRFGFALAADAGIVLPTTIGGGSRRHRPGEPSPAERATLWGGFRLAVHEYIHTLEHSAFGAASSGNRNMKEGFCEMFTKEILVPLLPVAASDSALVTAVEGGTYTPATTSGMVGSYSSGDYADYLAAAEAVRSAIPSGGEQAVRAAFFQGHVELIGLNRDGTTAPPRTTAADQIAVPPGIASLAALATASGVARDAITAANPGVDFTSMPARAVLPGCREHIVVAATDDTGAYTPETKAQIAGQNGVTEADLERANPIAPWAVLSAGYVVLIPVH